MIAKTITHTLMCGLLSILLAVLFVGCGGGKSETTEHQQTDPTNKQPADNSDNKPGETPSVKVNVDKKQGKMIGDVPYDVWFNDPITVSGDGRTIVATTTPNGNKPPTGMKPETKPTETPKPTETAGGKIEWKDVIPAEVLNDEVKKIRNRFSQDLRTVGSYNKRYLNFEPFCVSLAVLAEIASEHPGELRWKKNAKIIRDLAAQMVSEKLRSGAKSYKQINTPFEQIMDTLDGSPPSDVKKVNPEESFSDVAEMGQIMKRMEMLEKLIKENSGSESSFKENKDVLRRQSYVLAAITKALITEGYGYSDDEVFLKHANGMVEACKKMAVAAETDDFAAFEKAMPIINQSCLDCHKDYRN